jgi:hypothetical protein
MTVTEVKEPRPFKVYDNELHELHEYEFEHITPACGMECPAEGAILVNLFMKAMDYRRENFYGCGHMRSLTFDRKVFTPEGTDQPHVRYTVKIIT